MTPTERSEGYEPNQPPAFELRVWPAENESVVFERHEDGRFRLSLTGRVDVIFPAPNSLRGDLRADFGESGTQTPEPPIDAHTGQSSGDTEHSTQQEDKDEEPTVIFTGDIGFVGSLRKRKSGKRIIDFSVRTESDEGETENKHVRAFEGLAVFVSRNIRKNQSGVKVEAYPDKILPTWTQDRQTGEWQKTERNGYIAKNVRAPKGSQGKKPQRSS